MEIWGEKTAADYNRIRENFFKCKIGAFANLGVIMALVRLKNLSIAFGDKQILDEANLTIQHGQRIGLIGRNGEGKSTLLKILNGEILPDQGEIQFQEGVVVAALNQTAEFNGQGTVFEVVSQGLGQIGEWISEYHRLSSQSQQLDALSDLQNKLDSSDGWNLKSHVDKVLARLHLDGSATLDSLSGGWRRRVSLARALVSRPNLLLLDEPTNHLDIESIEWLERQVKDFNGAVLFVTHDRQFLQNITNQIVDLDRGRLQSWAGSYDDFMRRKQAAVEEEIRHNQAFDKKLAEEEAWIRKGIKARRTRNEGRVRALKKLREERSQRIHSQGKVNFQFEIAANSGKKVIEAHNISYAHSAAPIVDGFSTRIFRGDRVGLIGPNGIGKTTLIKLLLGELTPQAGKVEIGINVQVAYFDQNRHISNPDARVIDIVGGGKENIEINGKSRHVISYLSDFLFSPQRARSPIKSLSGGERARVLLAQLFSKPANLLVMDEPTNDLDIETLELLEELLMQFQGTLLLVSHDRKFMDNVVTSTLSFEGQGKVSEYVGGYEDWLRQRPAPEKTEVQKKSAQKQASQSKPTKKLSYKFQRELDELPRQIEELESRQEDLTNRIQQSDFYSLDENKKQKTLQELDQVSKELEDKFERWTELESQI